MPRRRNFYKQPHYALNVILSPRRRVRRGVMLIQATHHLDNRECSCMKTDHYLLLSHGCTRIKCGCMVAQAPSLCLRQISSDDFPSQRRKGVEENIPVVKVLQAVSTLAFGTKLKAGLSHSQNQPLSGVIACEATQSHEQKVACTTDRRAFST